MKPDKTSVYDLFYNQRRFAVPLYQRPVRLVPGGAVATSVAGHRRQGTGCTAAPDRCSALPRRHRHGPASGVRQSDQLMGHHRRSAATDDAPSNPQGMSRMS